MFTCHETRGGEPDEVIVRCIVLELQAERCVSPHATFLETNCQFVCLKVHHARVRRGRRVAVVNLSSFASYLNWA